MSGVDFSDAKKAEAWLAKQSIEVRSAIASSAALRVLANISLFDIGALERRALPLLRAILTSALHGSGRNANIDWRNAHSSAHSAARAVHSPHSADRLTHSAHSAALSAARSTEPTSLSAARSTAASAYSARAIAGSASFAAYDELAGISITRFTTAVWPAGTLPEVIEENHEGLLAFFNDDRSTWGFWHDWYLAMWEGRWTDWDLAHEVAKIDNDVWEAGAEAIAAEIEQIKARRLRDALPQAEHIKFNVESSTFTAISVDLTKADLIGATLQQVEDSLDDVMATSSNGLSEDSREVRVITRTIQKYGNNPQQIEMGFVSAHAGMTRQMVVGDLPPSEENLALQSALEEGAVAIRATHPDVAENRAILTKRKFAELSPEQKEQLSDALPILTAISDEALADDWKHDIPALINTSMGPLPTGAPPVLGADEATRIFSRVAKISILLRTGNIIHQIDQSAAYKGARIVGTVGGLVSIGLALLVLI